MRCRSGWMMHAILTGFAGLNLSSASAYSLMYIHTFTSHFVEYAVHPLALSRPALILTVLSNMLLIAYSPGTDRAA